MLTVIVVGGCERIKDDEGEKRRTAAEENIRQTRRDKTVVPIPTTIAFQQYLDNLPCTNNPQLSPFLQASTVQSEAGEASQDGRPEPCNLMCQWSSASARVHYGEERPHQWDCQMGAFGRACVKSSRSGQWSWSLERGNDRWSEEDRRFVLTGAQAESGWWTRTHYWDVEGPGGEMRGRVLARVRALVERMEQVQF